MAQSRTEQLARQREHNLKQTEIKRQRRTAWIAANGPCQICGWAEDLQVDHIDPSTKHPALRPRGRSSDYWGWSEGRRRAELAKCQVLCIYCHRLKSACERIAQPRHKR